MNPIYLTEKDHERLHSLVQLQRQTVGAAAVEGLCMELKVVPEPHRLSLQIAWECRFMMRYRLCRKCW